MTTSAWIDLADTIAAKDGAVFDDSGAEIPGRKVLRLLDELQDDPEERGLPLGGGGQGGQPYEATVAVPPRARGTHHRETDTETVSVSLLVFAPRRHKISLRILT
jgi:hypothetical protein